MIAQTISKFDNNFIVGDVGLSGSDISVQDNTVSGSVFSDATNVVIQDNAVGSIISSRGPGWIGFNASSAIEIFAPTEIVDNATATTTVFKDSFVASGEVLVCDDDSRLVVTGSSVLVDVYKDGIVI